MILREMMRQMRLTLDHTHFKHGVTHVSRHREIYRSRRSQHSTSHLLHNSIDRVGLAYNSEAECYEQPKEQLPAFMQAAL
jgi:hypothetical protein